MKVQGNEVHAFAINLFSIFVFIIPFFIPYTFLLNIYSLFFFSNHELLCILAFYRLVNIFIILYIIYLFICMQIYTHIYIYTIIFKQYISIIQYIYIFINSPKSL